MVTDLRNTLTGLQLLEQRVSTRLRTSSARQKEQGNVSRPLLFQNALPECFQMTRQQWQQTENATVLNART